MKEVLVAYSCDKNFGLYRDRVGAVFVRCVDTRVARVAQAHLQNLARPMWSMPPDHGAAVVRTLLEDAEFEDAWTGELADMRRRINGVRGAVGSFHPRLSPLKAQKGLFSTLPLSPRQIERLAEDDAIYVAPLGRLNLAGLKAVDVERFSEALVRVLEMS